MSKIIDGACWVLGAIVIIGFYGLIGGWMLVSIDSTLGRIGIVAVYGGAALLSLLMLLKMARGE